jgi:hypothetical protein
LSSFAVQTVVNKQHKIVLEKFALDELKLIAIVAGDDMASKAMFVDPTGMGVTVQRGDHVSKVDAWSRASRPTACSSRSRRTS